MPSARDVAAHRPLVTDEIDSSGDTAYLDDAAVLWEIAELERAEMAEWVSRELGTQDAAALDALDENDPVYVEYRRRLAGVTEIANRAVTAERKYASSKATVRRGWIRPRRARPSARRRSSRPRRTPRRSTAPPDDPPPGPRPGRRRRLDEGGRS